MCCFGQGDGRVPGDGHVNYTYPSGDVYVGSMVGGKRQGQGTYLEHATGNTYEGEWKADLRHGKGGSRCSCVGVRAGRGKTWDMVKERAMA